MAAEWVRGALCNHRSVKEVSKHDYPGSYTCDCKIVTECCADCNKIWRKQRWFGKLTGIQYSESIVKQSTCDHEHYNVYEDTREDATEDSMIGFAVLLFTGGLLKGVEKHRFLKARATCLRCDCSLVVRAECGHVWKDGQQVLERTTSWTPATKTHKKQVRETTVVSDATDET